MKAVDPVQLQRLIDGELECAEMQKLLADVEAADIGWKSIALGLIENQIFSSVFNAIEPDPHPPVHAATGRRSDSVSMPQFSFLSLAASALLTLSLGTLIGANFWGPVGQSGSAGIPLAATNHVADRGPDTLAGKLAQNDKVDQRYTNNPAVYRMQLQDNQGNQFVDTDLPFYEVSNWNEFDWGHFQEIPPDLRDRVLSAGYDLQQQTRYLQGRLDDGRPFIVPIRSTKLSPFQ